jgi:hypothetical protein
MGSLIGRACRDEDQRSKPMCEDCGSVLVPMSIHAAHSQQTDLSLILVVMLSLIRSTSLSG